MKGLNEYIQCSDSKIRGIVTAKVNGKELFTKENMIVGDGRDFIFNLFLHANNVAANSAGEVSINASAKENQSFLAGVFFGSEISSTNVSYVLGENVKTIAFSNAAVNNDCYALIQSADTSDRSVKFSITLDGSSDKITKTSQGFFQLSELGLYYFNGTMNKAFSRITFDVVPIDETTKFTAEYAIYF